MIEPKWLLFILAYCLIREVYFLYSVHSLLNKLMSRNYHEYQITTSRGKMKVKQDPVKVDNDPIEDFGVFSGIG